MTYAPASITNLARLWASHGGKNLGIVGDTHHVAKGRSYHLGRAQLVAVDFAATPTDDVWRGANRINSGATDHGGLNVRVDSMDAVMRATVCDEIRAISEEALKLILDEIPDEWATAGEKAVMLAELLRRKEELLAELQ